MSLAETAEFDPLETDELVDHLDDSSVETAQDVRRVALLLVEHDEVLGTNVDDDGETLRLHYDYNADEGDGEVHEVLEDHGFDRTSGERVPDGQSVYNDYETPVTDGD